MPKRGALRSYITMKFFDAVQLADSKKHLVGKTIKGTTLDEIIIVPTSTSEFDAFKLLYVQTLDAQQSIIPFMNSDVDVVGVCDKSKIHKMGLFNYIRISEIKE